MQKLPALLHQMNQTIMRGQHLSRAAGTLLQLAQEAAINGQQMAWVAAAASGVAGF